ncbi:hypothetical protein [Spirosoma koreense]
MKALYLFFGMLLASALLAPVSIAQRSAKRWTNYDAVTTYGIGLQSVNLSQLNQALQQAGYSPLSGQLPTFSVASQFSRPNRPLSFHAEAGLSFGSGTTATNGTYKAQAGMYYAKLGGSYRLVGTDRFQLSPQLSVVSLPFHLRVSPVSNTTPALNSVLTNPGVSQTTTLRSTTIGLDAGLAANLRFPYSQRQIDCSTIERSFVVGLVAGYRLAANAPLNASQEVSSSNPGIQLSGWYAGVRLGFGMRVRSTTAPVTY